MKLPPKVDRPSWRWRRVLVFGLGIALLLVWVASLALRASDLIDTATYDITASVLRIVFPVLVTAYVGGAVFDDATWAKIKNRFQQNQDSKPI